MIYFIEIHFDVVEIIFLFSYMFVGSIVGNNFKEVISMTCQRI